MTSVQKQGQRAIYNNIMTPFPFPFLDPRDRLIDWGISGKGCPKKSLSPPLVDAAARRKKNNRILRGRQTSFATDWSSYDEKNGGRKTTIITSSNAIQITNGPNFGSLWFRSCYRLVQPLLLLDTMGRTPATIGWVLGQQGILPHPLLLMGLGP